MAGAKIVARPPFLAHALTPMKPLLVIGFLVVLGAVPVEASAPVDVRHRSYFFSSPWGLEGALYWVYPLEEGAKIRSQANIDRDEDIDAEETQAFIEYLKHAIGGVPSRILLDGQEVTLRIRVLSPILPARQMLSYLSAETCHSRQAPANRGAWPSSLSRAPSSEARGAKSL